MTDLPQVSPEQADWRQQDFLAALRPGQLLVELFEAVPGAYFFIKDTESRFMGGSDSFARTLGEESIQALLGKTDYDFSPDFLADAFLADDRQVMESGEPVLNRIELVPTQDGSLDWLSTTKIPLYSREGDIIGLAGVTRRIRDSDAVYAEHPEMHRIVDYVREHYREKISVGDMARCGGISVSSQERLFRKTFGLTPRMYVRKTRLNAACKLLREGEASLADIAVQCGFNDQNSMTRAFRLELKITPLRYRRRFSEGRQRLRNRRQVI
jgi:AraC-like DNA-binding protein